MSDVVARRLSRRIGGPVVTLAVDIRLRRAGFDLDVAFEAGPGVTALFGPSGAGKTTVARVVAGLERGASGRVVVAGRDVTGLPPHRRRVACMFQEARLFPHLDVARNLTFGAARGTDPRPMAERLAIDHLLDRRPAGLSGGEAARVALGRALLSDPALLILDEPLAALDHRLKAQVLPHLERLRDGGLPVLYISHAMDEVARLADTLVLMQAGRAERVGPLAAMLSDPSAAALIGPMAAGAVLTGRAGAREDGLTVVDTAAGRLRLPGIDAAPGARLRLRLLASDVIVAIEPPRGLSALNVLPATIEAVHEGGGPGVMLRLRAGDAALLARVTRVSATALDLRPGRSVWAILKASGVSRADIGTGG